MALSVGRRWREPTSSRYRRPTSETLPRGEIRYGLRPSRVLSMYVGPDDVLVTMDLDFDGGTAASEAGTPIEAVERQVRERLPIIKRLFIEAGAAPPKERWSRPDGT